MKINVKKLCKYILFLGVLFCMITTPVFAEGGDINICSYAGTLKAFRIIGYVLKIVCIVVPILLIIITIVSVSKTILSGDAGDISKHISTFVKRLIAAVAVFFVPMIFDFIFNSLVSNDTSSYKTCTVCLFDPGDCEIPEKDPTTIDE